MRGNDMTTYLDKNQTELKNGDIIDIHQTVNGQNIFIVLNVSPLDIRYTFDVPYEYDKEELLSPSKFTGEVEWEIINS
jgi:hypothetical protein